MRLVNGGLLLIERAGWVASVGGGFKRSYDGVEEDTLPIRLLESRVFDINVGE